MIKQLSRLELISMFSDDTKETTANLNSEVVKNSKSPLVTVEKRTDENYNVIGGFKFVYGLQKARSNMKIDCLVIPAYETEKDRLLAILQRCLVEDYRKPLHKEILIYRLCKQFKMSKSDISKEIGINSDRIERYMYRQIIPATYYQQADEKFIKPFVQAIYLNKSFSQYEKSLLTELALEGRFLSKHIPIYKKYRKRYLLFEDLILAKNQVVSAVNTEHLTDEYWNSISHPENILSSIHNNTGGSPTYPVN
ncbi:hypothetical protein ACQCVK_13485 [Rossellomorea vietnamensis]|uniref:hypothetical protein n=1 Tax=Rossellomorea vietnamensis TaxID=218284 RepID=UPI003CE8D5A4